MIFTKDLLIKGLAGLALCTGTAALGVHYMGGFSSLYGEVKVTEKDLGLPEGCTFPAADATEPTSCNLTAESIKSIKFDGKNATATSLTGTVAPLATLQISKDTDFPFGYLFTVSVPSTNTTGTLTINREAANGGNIVINTNNSVDFKIKQNADKIFSLEKVGKEEILAIKAGLKRKAEGSSWTIDETKSGISIKHDGSTSPEKNKTKAPAQQGVTEGKIKAYGNADTNTYNQGFKFVIEDGNIALSNGTVGTSITKLEQFETYEIKKEGEEWILNRKTKAIDEIKTLLGLPANANDCTEVNDISECSLDEAKLRNIKFEGKGNENVTITEINSANLKLKISRTTDTNFTFGYKFVLESAKDVSIPQTANSSTPITIKANTNTEFKIKKAENSNALTLEKAWTVISLGEKINLTGCPTDATSTKQCDFGTSINVYESAASFVKGASLAESSRGKKINYELDQEDHNQGIKFYISDSAEDITINGGAATGQGVTATTTISKKASSNSGPTYEIKEMNGTWYLFKKA